MVTFVRRVLIGMTNVECICVWAKAMSYRKIYKLLPQTRQ